MKNLKRIISIALCITMIGAMSLTVFADEIENAEPVQEATENVVEQITEDEITEEETASEQTEAEPAEQTEETVSEQTEAVVPEQAEAVVPEQAETTVPEQSETALPEQAETTVPEQVVTPEAVNAEINVAVNGTPIVFEDVKPQVISERTFLPFRKVGEALNAAIAWRALDNTVHFLRNGKSVMMKIGESTMELREYEVKNGYFVYTTEAEIVPIDSNNPSITAFASEGRTMVPVRAIATILGADPEKMWNADTRTVNIEIEECKLTLDEKDSAELIEKWNYVPTTELKTGAVEVTVAGNFEGATPDIGDGVVVKINGKEQTAANGGACAFDEMKAGTYTVTVENIPEGYALSSTEEIKVTVEAGKKASVRINLIVAEAKVEAESEAK